MNAPKLLDRSYACYSCGQKHTSTFKEGTEKIEWQCQRCKKINTKTINTKKWKKDLS